MDNLIIEGLKKELADVINKYNNIPYAVIELMLTDLLNQVVNAKQIVIQEELKKGEPKNVAKHKDNSNNS